MVSNQYVFDNAPREPLGYHPTTRVPNRRHDMEGYPPQEDDGMLGTSTDQPVGTAPADQPGMEHDDANMDEMSTYANNGSGQRYRFPPSVVSKSVPLIIP